MSQPELQNDPTDWYFMDSLVFAELDAFAYHTMTADGSVNWAFVFAGHNRTKYYLYAVSLPVVGLVLRYLAPPGILAYLVVKEYGTAAIALGVLWFAYLVLRVISFPARRRMKEKSLELLHLMVEVYSHLGGAVISPSRLVDAIDGAARAGVAFDGALFAIADRIMKRDATAFVPFRP